MGSQEIISAAKLRGLIYRKIFFQYGFLVFWVTSLCGFFFFLIMSYTYIFVYIKSFSLCLEYFSYQ